MSIRTAVRRYAADIGRAFGHAPLECSIMLGLAVLYSAVIEDNLAGNEAAHITVAAILIAGGGWSATLLHAMNAITTRARWGMTCAAAALGILYLLVTRNMAVESEAWRAFMLVSAAALLVFATPALRADRGQNTLRMRRVNGRFFLRVVGIYLYGLTLFAGLAIALGAISNLFDLRVKPDIYGHVFVWIMLVLVPWVIIGGLQDYVRPLDEVSEVARVVHRLATFLLPPLTAIYYLILFAYVIRIGITHELPRNLVSPMVIAAGLLSCIALIVFDPNDDTSAGTRWLRFAPIAFLPLAPLALWALHARTDAYGWTEFRIIRVTVVMVLELLAIAATTQLLRKQRMTLRAIPIALAAVFVVMAVGPWGAGPVSRRNQQHRLAAGFAALGIDPRRPPVDTVSRPVPKAQWDRINGPAMYLESSFGPGAVTAVAPAWPGAGVSMASYYHLEPVGGNTPPSELTWIHMPENERMATPDADIYRISGSTRQRDARVTWTSMDTLFVALPTDTVFVRLGANVLTAALNSKGLHELSAAAAALPVTGKHTSVDGYLTLLELEVQNKNGHNVVSQVSGILTMKRRQP